MPMDLTSGLPFVLLWLALGTAMLPRVRWAWQALASLSIAAAAIAGIVEWAGLAVIILFAWACLAATRATLSTPVRTLAWAILVIGAIALAAHAVPWINSVLIVNAATASSPVAQPYTLFWNYDKALAGVLLYAACVQPQRRTEWSRAIVATATITVLTAALVVVPGMAAGLIVWGPKWPVFLLMWVPANLLVTCLAEEAFFRGLLQRHLAEALSTHVPSAGLVALFVTAAAFGIAHIGGGVAYAALATLAALGYGAAYHVTERVEASILVHFALNLGYLVLFTDTLIASS